MAKKVVKTIQGYEVIKPYREWAISYLKTYPTLRRSHDSLEIIDGLKNGWSEKVISKAAIESHITLMEEALSQIPECYRKAVLHHFPASLPRKFDQTLSISIKWTTVM